MTPHTPTAAAQSLPRLRRRVGDERVAALALALLGVLFGALALYVARGTTFFFDEWDFLLNRRGISSESLLAPHNGSLSLAPVVLFKGLLQIAGADGHWLFRLTLLALHLTAVVLTFRLISRRATTVTAALGATLILVIGRSADNLIWPAQLAFLLAIVGGLTALAGLDRDDRRGELLACGGLILGLASSSVAIPFAAVAAVQIACEPGRRRRIWVVAVPLALYGAWSLRFGDSQLNVQNIVQVPAFATTMAANAAGAVFGLDVQWGRTLLIVAVAALALWFVRGGPVSARMMGLLAGLLTMWTLTALARAGISEPTVPHYTYASAVLGLLVAAEAVGRTPLRARTVGVASAVVLLAVALGAASVWQRGAELRADSADVRARLAAMALAGTAVPFDFRPVPRQPQVVAGRVQVAQRDFGRIALPLAQLPRAPAAQRDAADDVLRRLLTPRVLALPTRPRPGSCPPARGELPFARAGRGLVIAAPAGAELRLRAFADAPAAVVAIPSPGALVRPAPGERAIAWKATIVGAGTIRACSVAE